MHGVSTNPGTGVKNKSYGNVAKFWERAIMSAWNSVHDSLDRNPCWQKRNLWLSLSMCSLVICKINPEIILPKHSFLYQWSVSGKKKNQHRSISVRTAARCFRSLIKATFRWFTWNLQAADKAGTRFDTLSLSWTYNNLHVHTRVVTVCRLQCYLLITLNNILRKFLSVTYYFLLKLICTACVMHLKEILAGWRGQERQRGKEARVLPLGKRVRAAVFYL